MNQFQRAFTPESLAEAWEIFLRDFPEALWDTLYVTILATFFAIVIGLPLGMVLVAGDEHGIKPLPKGLMRVLNVLINFLRSVPFLILAVALCLMWLWEKNPHAGIIVCLVYAALCLALFILFFPYASGLPTSYKWLDFAGKFLHLYYAMPAG